jgi:hypothetical protein
MGMCPFQGGTDMSKATAIQVFSVLAVLVGLIVSYAPPPQNATAIWAIITMFMGYAIRDLFGVDQPVVISSTAPQLSATDKAAALPATDAPAVTGDSPK